LGKIPADFKGSATSFADLSKAGVNVLGYGNFITILVNFLILAAVIFMLVKQMNKMKKAEPPAPPAAIPEDVQLLRQIRDSLKK
jgi:large conductance mechanosensitive channel